MRLPVSKTVVLASLVAIAAATWIGVDLTRSSRIDLSSLREGTRHVVKILKTAEWFANTGIPLMATLVGLMVAFLFLRQQLRSDRELRRADHRRDAAGELGEVLIKSGTQLAKSQPFDAFWLSAHWPQYEVINDVIRVAAPILPPGSIGSVRALVDLVAEIWALAHIGSVFNSRNGRELVQSVLGAHPTTLIVLGERLLAWSGEGPMPPLNTLTAEISGSPSLTASANVLRSLTKVFGEASAAANEYERRQLASSARETAVLATALLVGEDASRNRVNVFRLLDDGTEMAPEISYGRGMPSQRIPRGGDKFFDLANAGSMYFVNNIDELHTPEGVTAGYETFFAYPVSSSQGRTYGVLVVESLKSGDLTLRRDAPIMGLLARLIGATYEISLPEVDDPQQPV
ncbi:MULTISPECIES: hypothetical protein [Mycolicibacter]|uniref:hypothetical protein n=1 Tax=Mycolicibacter TaxID=1073531 RepID=UPI0010562449|nr:MULTISPECIES: hypothetical protein [Mycolicibacter]